MQLNLYSEIPPILWRDVTNIAILAPHWLHFTKKEKDLALTKNLFVDNMVFEGTPLSIEDYFNVIMEIKNCKFVLPDVINDEESTFNEHKQFLQKIISYNPLLLNNAMAVIQGFPSLNYLEWIIKENIQYICFPYLPNIDRYMLIRDVVTKMNKLNKTNKKLPYIHLLGIEHVSELYLYAYETKYISMNMPMHLNIVSADSGILYYSSISEKCNVISSWDKFKLSEIEWKKRKLSHEQINFFKTRIQTLQKETNWKV